MISRCEQGQFDSEIIEKCENPKFDTSFQSLIPVTDTVTGVIYKNTYCTQCNKVNEAALKSWGFRIGCDEILHFPAKDMLVLEIYKANCTVNFVKVKYSESHDCEKPSYSISTCNETGQWQHHDELINQACDSFVAPFDFTFKNYFCYLCNSRTHVPYTVSKCHVPRKKDIRDFLPRFSVIVDIDTSGRWNLALSCDKTNQFQDKRLVGARCTKT